MTSISDFTTEAQQAVDSALKNPLHRLLHDQLQAAAKMPQFLSAVDSIQNHPLHRLMQDEVQAAAKALQSLGMSVEKLGQEFATVNKWAREREAMFAPVVVPLMTPQSKIDWLVVSPRTRSLDLEPSSERTIVRPEVKRKIGFVP